MLGVVGLIDEGKRDEHLDVFVFVWIGSEGVALQCVGNGLWGCVP